MQALLKFAEVKVEFSLMLFFFKVLNDIITSLSVIINLIKRFYTFTPRKNGLLNLQAYNYRQRSSSRMSPLQLSYDQCCQFSDFSITLLPI